MNRVDLNEYGYQTSLSHLYLQAVEFTKNAVNSTACHLAML
ncbi:hypothetical protein CYK57_00380 [Actinobacillus pleuropneumoniae]|nr:hypothetical protein appser2_2620 [Actinobacillus pleuropneumoniae serovar 2 str. S1536]EFM90553.1 hypothetical protein appser4_3040 [Actinobacillus pleuropneumoniae serovar 4 str. M62]EFM94919.1 hypothetical protein appser9_3000 [Actinobacillus pleuropneumoniae serovar 9 str. CVJ13261]EFM99258.1 hypothetical protein appser11_3020 [Actinobacillus pleuropneumoniae serovar 11 str. 56153]EFN01365.1 hypothetical protein appser12_3120 [Actinobacillus pleuropneumoniae serovar 12 str. 1096]QSZ3825